MIYTTHLSYFPRTFYSDFTVVFIVANFYSQYYPPCRFSLSTYSELKKAGRFGDLHPLSLRQCRPAKRKLQLVCKEKGNAPTSAWCWLLILPI